MVKKQVMKMKTVNILGTEYNIEIHKISEDTILEKNNFAGYCNEDDKLIVLADLAEEKYFPDMTEKEKDWYKKRTLRHEIIHAFLNESGLSACASVPAGAWARHEEMVDWIAIQFPKMMQVFKEVGCL